jgi:hypothetical protein
MPVIYTGSSIMKDVGVLYSASAYSFRQLGTNYVPAGYAGNCILVKRDWDSATLDIGFSGGWRDDTTMVDFVTGSGTHPTANGTIQIWYDQAGNSLDLSNLTITQQPLVVQSGVAVTQNSKPSAYFDGNRFLSVAFTSSNFTNICFSVFMTASITDRTTGRALFGIGQASSSNHCAMGWSPAPTSDYNFFYVGTDTFFHKTGTNDLSLFVGRNLYSIAEMSARNNGVLGGASGSLVPSTINILSIRDNPLTGTIKLGTPQFYGSNLIGYVSEFILFNNNIQDVLINQTIVRESDIISTYGL